LRHRIIRILERAIWIFFVARLLPINIAAALNEEREILAAVHERHLQAFQFIQCLIAASRKQYHRFSHLAIIAVQIRQRAQNRISELSVILVRSLAAGAIADRVSDYLLQRIAIVAFGNAHIVTVLIVE